ncbi:MAG: hypothetical protein NTW07_07695 [candidate division Zixibacteria bacterium]|nr:hypothetical protein [candidate division Zixibacteria bacterium]
MKSLRWYIVAFLLVGNAAAFAQGPADTVGSLPGIEINTSVDRAESYIGDLITYTLTIVYDSTYNLIPPPLGANLGAFEVKDYQPDIESKRDDGRLESRTIFVLCTYTTGDYTIPPLPVIFMLPDSTRKVMLAEPVPIKILSLLDIAGSDTLDIKPLKDPYEFPPDYTKYYIYGGIGLLVLAIAAIAFGWWLWKKQRAKAQLDLRSPWEVAFEKLAFLKVQYLEGQLADQLQAKEFYFQLTEIIRAYLGRIYKTDVLEMTTEEFLDTFHEIALPGETYLQLGEFFRHADQVKFAKLMPERVRIEDDFMSAHNVVERVRADYERRQAADVLTVASKVTEPQVTEEQKV